MSTHPYNKPHLPGTPRRPPARPPRTSLWADITKDPKTGHTVFKDFAKAIALLVGLGIIIAAAVADFQAGREISLEGAGIVLTYALGVGIQKTYEAQANRQTTDANGNPLAQPGTADPPADPKLMPQSDATVSPQA